MLFVDFVLKRRVREKGWMECLERAIVVGGEGSLPSYLAIMRFPYLFFCVFLISFVKWCAFCCIIVLRDFLMRFHYFLPL